MQVRTTYWKDVVSPPLTFRLQPEQTTAGHSTTVSYNHTLADGTTPNITDYVGSSGDDHRDAIVIGGCIAGVLALIAVVGIAVLSSQR